MPYDRQDRFVTRPFPAKYPFTCPECDFGHEAGNIARLVDDEIHCSSCAEDMIPTDHGHARSIDPDWG